jgi:hypothetical protein
MPKQKKALFSAKELKELLDAAARAHRGNGGRMGSTGHCIICYQGTTGGERNLCYTAREGRDCRKESDPSRRSFKPIPASPELKKIVTKLKRIIDGY